MGRKLGGVPVMIMTIILAGLGFFLRRTQLQTAFDAIGVIPGSKMTLIWVSVLVLLFIVGYILFCQADKLNKARKSA